MRALLVDDNQKYCAIFLEKMQEFCNNLGIQIVCDFRYNFQDALSSCEKYDIFFLDIELGDIEGMEDASGLNLAAKLRERFPDKEIVFISFHERYVWKSFDVKPVAYIRKKELEDDLHYALEAIIERRRRRDVEIEIPESRSGNVWIKPAEVLYCRSKEHYVRFVYMEKVSGLFRIKLDEVEEQLKEYCFVRAHKSYLVNLEYVKMLKKDKLQMVNGIEIPISRTHKKETQDALYQWKNKGKYGNC